MVEHPQTHFLARLLTTLAIVLAIPAPAFAQTQSQVIANHCRIEWPADAEMRAYCARQQRTGASEVRQAMRTRLGMSNTAFQDALENCVRDWPTDFEMQSYCLKQQARGYSAVNTPRTRGRQTAQETAQIKAHCREQWPTDYEMQAYCERQQGQGLANFKASNSTKKASCRRKWPADFEMQAYCIRQ